MQRTQTLYKKATTSVPEAVNELIKRYPGAEIDGIVVKAADASEARMAKVSVGERIFVATVKHAEFPAGDGPDEDSAPEDSAPDEEPKEEKPEPPKSEGEGESKSEKKPESKGDGEGADDGPPAGPEGEGKKPGKDDLLAALIEKLIDVLGGGGDDPLGGPGPDADPGIAEVGAPGAGEPMPPHAMKPHPSGGPAGHGAPLPPPVSKPAGPGGAAFAHYDPAAASFSVMRKDAGEIGNRGLILETESVYPTHRVAKITRTGLAEVNGELLDVAEAGIALLTLTKK